MGPLGLRLKAQGWTSHNWADSVPSGMAFESGTWPRWPPRFASVFNYYSIYIHIYSELVVQVTCSLNTYTEEDREPRGSDLS